MDAIWEQAVPRMLVIPIPPDIPRYPDIPIPRYPDTPIPRYPDTPIPRYPDTPIPRYPDTPMPSIQHIVFNEDHGSLVSISMSPSPSAPPLHLPPISHVSSGHAVHHPHLNSTLGLLLLLDGVGLAIITGSTILEGFEIWDDVFDHNWENNEIASLVWLLGRTSQIIGLILLIGATFSLNIITF
jgi:hypothetical protein